jgi:hypothetical protein
MLEDDSGSRSLPLAEDGSRPVTYQGGSEAARSNGGQSKPATQELEKKQMQYDAAYTRGNE